MKISLNGKSVTTSLLVFISLFFFNAAFAVTDLSKSTLTSSSSRSDLNGSGVTITFQSKDSAGVNDTTGSETVNFFEDGSASIGASCVTGVGTGACSVALTNTVAERVTVTAQISGNNVTDNAKVTFYSLDGSLEDWLVILQGDNFDPGGDQQAVSNSSIDIIGTGEDGTMYAIYDGGLLTDENDDKICYRVRVGGSKSNSFSGFLWIGINIDPLSDGDNDVYLRVDGNGKSGGLFDGDLYVFDSGTGANTSPSSSDVANGVLVKDPGPLVDGEDFSFDQIGSSPDPDPNVVNSDINRDGETDWMVSWCADWTDLRDVVNTKPIKGGGGALISSINSGAGLQRNSPLAFTLSSSINGNNVNSDVGGYDGTVDNNLTYEEVDATSGVIDFEMKKPLLTVYDTDVYEGIATSQLIVDANATDDDSNVLIFSLSGDDSGDFTIDPATGEIFFAAVPNFAAPTDANTDNAYELKVEATDEDDNVGHRWITITVLDAVVGTGVQLAFGQQPSDTLSASNISPTVTVQVLDGFGDVVTTSTASITLELSLGTGPLNGTLVVAPINGVATFAGLNIAVVDAYRIKAMATGLDFDISDTFYISDADSSLSNLSVIANNADADGSDANEVRATILDSGSSPLEGDRVSFSASNGATIVQSCITNASGQCSVTLTNSLSGTSNVSATVGSVALSNSPIATNFTALAGAPQVSSILRQNPASSPANVNSLVWRVTFDMDVNNVDATDFTVTGSTATVSNVSTQTANSVFDVTVSGGNLAGLNGVVTIGFDAGQDIKNGSAMALADTTPTGTNENSYVVDNTEPTVGIDALSTANNGNEATYPVEGTCSIGDGNVSVTVTGLTAQDVACIGGLWTTSFDVSGLADGVNTITVNASQTDSAGNTGDATQEQADKDTSTPSAASCAVVPNPANEDTAITATCTGVESGATISIPDYSCAAESGNEVTCTATAGSDAGEIGGDATATITDTAGNANTSTASFTLDNTNPSAASCTVDPNPANEDTAITATCTGVESGATISIPDYSCGVESGNEVTCTATAGSDAGEVSGDATATITDTAGNTNTSTASFTLSATAVSISALATANIANETAYPVSGSCTFSDGDVTVTITGIAADTASCLITGDWSASFDVSSISDGINAITVNASQNGVNASQKQADKDTSAPSAASCTVDPNPANEGTAITATCTGVESGATLMIPDYSCGAESGNEVTCTATAGSDAGEISGDATATITDTAGNTNTSTASFTLDNAAPTVAVDALSIANLSNESTYEVTGTCSIGDGNVSVMVTGLTAQDVACIGGLWTTSFDVSGLADGVNAITVNASQTDSAGNTGDATQEQADKDASAPSAATCTVDPNPANEGTAITATCTGVESSATISIPDYSCGAESGNEVTCTATAGSDAGEISGDATATITDTAGNANTSTASFTLDNTNPSAASCTVTPNPANEGTAITATCTGVESGATISIPDYSCGAESGNEVTCTATAGSDAGEVSGDATATITDTAGNTNTSTASFTLDNTDPVVAIDDLSAANNSNKTTYPVTGICSIGDGNVSVTLTGLSGQSVACIGGMWTTSFNVSGIADGTNAITVNASQTDTSGNTGDASQQQADKDTVVPTPVIDTASSSPSSDETISYTVDFGESVTDFVATDVVVNGASLNVVSFSDDGNGEFSFTVTASVDGEITVNIAAGVASDLAGNGNNVATELSITFVRDSDGDGISDVKEDDLGTDPEDEDSDGDGVTDDDEIGDPDDPNDSDGDGVIDALDTDDDNDGIATVDETDGSGVAIQTDSDGIPDHLDTDSDNDGVADFFEGNQDTDGDGIEDFRDEDSDNDGIPDGVEAGLLEPEDVDSDADGIDDAYDADVTDGNDSNNNGVDDDMEPRDTDGDSIADFREYDSDNDGIPDLIEGNVDSDADGMPDYRDLDSDNDGISDFEEAGIDIAETSASDADADGIDDAHDVDETGGEDVNSNGIDDAQEPIDSDEDGTPDYIDLDSDADSIPDSLELVEEPAVDTDVDEVPDFRDVDADNDGLPDVLESDLSGVDTDGDGIDDDIDVDETSGADANNDGVDDSYELPDTDGDGLSNHMDTDSDNDGITDGLEAGASGDDSDDDGIDDAFDVDETGGDDNNGDGVDDNTIVNDTDGDGYPNHLDLDSDNDGETDSVEIGDDNDLNEDGFADDGIFTGTPRDTDGDSIPDYIDPNVFGENTLPDEYSIYDTDPADGMIDADEPDTDGDGIPDVIDGSPDNFGASFDTDGDGILDYQEGLLGLDPNNPDSDNDGISDSVEVGDINDPNDYDGDGIIDALDEDDDGDGIPTKLETQGSGGQKDSDGDGVPDYLDIDSDNDGILDSVEGSRDSDGDGKRDFRDRDSDGDGIYDLIENGLSALDENSDGKADDLSDKNKDGLPDVFEDELDNISKLLDTDGDGTPNTLDLDSDNDGFPDRDEYKYLNPEAPFNKDKGMNAAVSTIGAMGISYIFLMFIIAGFSLMMRIKMRLETGMNTGINRKDR